MAFNLLQQLVSGQDINPDLSTSVDDEEGEDTESDKKTRIIEIGKNKDRICGLQ